MDLGEFLCKDMDSTEVTELRKAASKFYISKKQEISWPAKYHIWTNKLGVVCVRNLFSVYIVDRKYYLKRQSYIDNPIFNSFSSYLQDNRMHICCEDQPRLMIFMWKNAGNQAKLVNELCVLNAKEFYVRASVTTREVR
jgi:hypothetical protein